MHKQRRRRQEVGLLPFDNKIYDLAKKRAHLNRKMLWNCNAYLENFGPFAIVFKNRSFTFIYISHLVFTVCEIMCFSGFSKNKSEGD